MKDFRGPLPLDDRDFGEVRHNVLGRIERRPPVMRYLLAAAAAIALVFVLMPRKQQPKIVPRPNVETGFSPSTKPAAATLPPSPAPQVTRAKARVHKQRGGPPPDTQITMNIETADPNVRIIWISR